MPARRSAVAAFAALLLVAALAGGAWLVAGNRIAGQPPRIETRLVVETRVVVETRERLLVVTATATPSPTSTPGYVSRVHAATGTLVYPLMAEPASLDPQEPGEPGWTVVAQLYEALYDLDGAVAVPAAAESHAISADGLTYTLRLRQGLTWTDGRPTLAQHYVDGICRLISPAVGNDRGRLLVDDAPIAGAGAFASGSVPDCSGVGVRAVDAYTLQIVLERPAAQLLQVLAAGGVLPVRLDQGGNAVRPGGAPVTNGPFRLGEWVTGDHITLLRDPGYLPAPGHRPASPRAPVERITFRFVPDRADQVALYRQGDLMVSEPPPEDVADLLAEPGIAAELAIIPRAGSSFLVLNAGSGPTSDVNFRRAIASAIDRSSLIRQTLARPWLQAAQTVIPPGVTGYQGGGTTGYAYDVAAAGRYLSAAGYGPGNMPPPVDVWINREGNNPALFQSVVDMLERAGMPARLVTGGWDVYLRSLQACRYRLPGEACPVGAHYLGWTLAYPDGAAVLARVTAPGSSLMATGWTSEPYRTLLARAAAETLDSRRAALYAAADKLLVVEEAIVVPLLHYVRPLLIKGGITACFPSAGPPLFRYWSLSR